MPAVSSYFFSFLFLHFFFLLSLLPLQFFSACSPSFPSTSTSFLLLISSFKLEDCVGCARHQRNLVTSFQSFYILKKLGCQNYFSISEQCADQSFVQVQFGAPLITHLLAALSPRLRIHHQFQRVVSRRNSLTTTWNFSQSWSQSFFSY